MPINHWMISNKKTEATSTTTTIDAALFIDEAQRLSWLQEQASKAINLRGTEAKDKLTLMRQQHAEAKGSLPLDSPSSETAIAHRL